MNFVIAENKEWIDRTWEKIDAKLSRTALKSRNKLPYTTVDGTHDDMTEKDVTWWTNGFWGGMMWLMYKGTGNEEYRKTAERSEQLLDAALRQYKRLHHDVGFTWHLVSGANYRLTGNEASCTRNLYAAASLCSRYNIDGGFIRAWNAKDAAGYSIIDCLMNLSLLYWASEELGDDRFKKIAMRHMDMAARDHIRENGSTNHIVEHYLDKPGVKQVHGGQGYSPTSCWSRGTAWAIYGSVISYYHTKKPEYLEAAKKTIKYFVEQIQKTGYLPLSDFDQPAEPVVYDSSAGLCAACGMLELSKLLPEEEGRWYAEEVMKMLKAYDEAGWFDFTDEMDGIVMNATGSYPTDARKDAPNYKEIMKSVNVPIIWGDFFFIEAMCKLKGRDFFIW